MAERTLLMEIPASDVLHMHIVRSKAARDVLAERQRQIEREGYTPEHDDEHTADDLADAAAAYALVAHFARTGLPAADVWPWEPDSFKPRDQRQNYVRAAALLQAAIELLDRAAASGVGVPCQQVFSNNTPEDRL